MAFINGKQVLFSPQVNVTERDVDVVQEPGLSETAVMSQKAASLSFANALKGSKSGTAVVLGDISPVEHEMGVTVKKKNLLPYPFSQFQAVSGIYTNNGDGSVTIDGTVSTVNSCPLVNFTLPAGTYTIGSGLDNSHGVSVRLYDAKTGANIAHSIASTIKTFTISEPTAVRCLIYATQGKTYDNIRVYPMIEEGTKETAYAPYVEDFTTATVKRYGKNLCDLSALTTTANKQVAVDLPAGATYTVSALVVAGEGTSPSGRLGWIYTLNGTDVYSERGGWIGVGAVASNTVTIPSEATNIRLLYQHEAGTASLTWEDIQIEPGDTPTSFEPFVEPTEHAVSEDGMVVGVTSLYPCTTLLANIAGVTIDCEYNRDINKAFAELQAALLSMGGNV